MNGKNKVEVLLLEPEAIYCDMVIERILSKWKKTDASKGCDISYEMEIIK